MKRSQAAVASTAKQLIYSRDTVRGAYFVPARKIELACFEKLQPNCIDERKIIVFCVAVLFIDAHQQKIVQRDWSKLRHVVGVSG
jgi:hypothetical protein